MPHHSLVVLTDLRELIDEIAPDQRPLPTPCPKLDVGALQGHLRGWLAVFAAAFADPDGDERPSPDHYGDSLNSDELIAEIERVTTATREALDQGLETRTVNLPALGGALPGTVALDSLAIEVIGHCWDLSRATGAPYEPDPSLVEAVLASTKKMILPEYRGPGMPFGAEVIVADAAAPLDRFVAFLGRDPEWTP
ncbi:TIGR03086 family protein [Streptomyces sp. MUSC 14]|uniref:TIGR03086 family metal-binding protein n=1 Tax=Streptomyces sp. MUSC 14 TaxID=1354889 RepID=UPI0008F560F7|nr:TIGR03086 family metal-binding protein [Streptomyces sp. MUSC 14]OIJ98946.1 TIGR03086 family protein [Streptomyces sp. MUSC 14]